MISTDASDVGKHKQTILIPIDFDTANRPNDTETSEMNAGTPTTNTTKPTSDNDNDEPAIRPMAMEDSTITTTTMTTTTEPPTELSDQWKAFIKARVERMMSGGKLPQQISAQLAFNGSKQGCQRVQFIDGQVYIYLHQIETMARW